MSEAYECDRCGSLHAESPHSFIAIGDGYERWSEIDRVKEEPGKPIDTLRQSEDVYDICPGCKNSFEEWMDYE